MAFQPDSGDEAGGDAAWAAAPAFQPDSGDEAGGAAEVAAAPALQPEDAVIAAEATERNMPDGVESTLPKGRGHCS